MAPTALAQSSGTGYGGQGGVAGQVSQGGGPGNGNGAGGVAGTTASGATGNAGSQATGGNRLLAFTGLDVAGIAGGGLVLMLSGVAMRRLVGRPQV